MSDELTQGTGETPTVEAGAVPEQAETVTVPAAEPRNVSVEPTEGTQQSGQASLSRPPAVLNDVTHAPYNAAFVVADCQRQASNFCHWQGSYCPSCNTYLTNDGDTLRSIAAQIWGVGGDQWTSLAHLNLNTEPGAAGDPDQPLRSGTLLVLP